MTRTDLWWDMKKGNQLLVMYPKNCPGRFGIFYDMEGEWLVESLEEESKEMEVPCMYCFVVEKNITVGQRTKSERNGMWRTTWHRSLTKWPVECVLLAASLRNAAISKKWRNPYKIFVCTRVYVQGGLFRSTAGPGTDRDDKHKKFVSAGKL